MHRGIPLSTIRDRLEWLAERGLAGSAHRTSALGSHAQRLLPPRPGAPSLLDSLLGLRDTC